MYKNIFKIDCASSKGKSKIYEEILFKENQFIIVDGEAFGNEILEIEKVLRGKIHSSIFFLLPLNS